VPIVGRAAQELSLVYAGDLADALVTVATHPACAGGTYALVHPEIVTQHGLGAAIARAVGRRVLRPRIPAAIVWWALTLNEAAGRLRGRATFLSRDKARELLAPAWTARPDALARDTGWTAPTTLAAGLSRTVAWYREAGWR
jgi:nucleoside-diphosphate-sugar epimerase